MQHEAPAPHSEAFDGTLTGIDFTRHDKIKYNVQQLSIEETYSNNDPNETDHFWLPTQKHLLILSLQSYQQYLLLMLYFLVALFTLFLPDD